MGWGRNKLEYLNIYIYTLFISIVELKPILLGYMYIYILIVDPRTASIVSEPAKDPRRSYGPARDMPEVLFGAMVSEPTARNTIIKAKMVSAQRNCESRRITRNHAET